MKNKSVQSSKTRIDRYPLTPTPGISSPSSLHDAMLDPEPQSLQLFDATSSCIDFKTEQKKWRKEKKYSTKVISGQRNTQRWRNKKILFIKLDDLEYFQDLPLGIIINESINY